MYLCIYIRDIINDSGEEFAVVNRSKHILYLHSDKPLRHYRKGEIRILWQIPFRVLHSTDHNLDLSLSDTVWSMGSVNCEGTN